MLEPLIDIPIKLSDHVTVYFAAQKTGYYFPKVIVDSEVMGIPLMFYPEVMDSAQAWLKDLQGFEGTLEVAYQVITGALSYALKYPK